MNKETKDINKNMQKEQKVMAKKLTEDSAAINYGYYSKLLNQPFDSLGELRAAEQEYYDKIKAKEDKANQKKADAQKVEAAFKGLNAERKIYKEDLTALTQKYSEDLTELKNRFEKARDEIKESLAAAEERYSTALKDFTDKYPEGYHLTLKDGDFETTIRSSSTARNVDTSKVFDLFDWIFNF